jgi:hypothetical protein
LRSPSSFIVAGSSTARTIVASIRIATARPTPSCFIDWFEPVANAANVTTMTAAALVMTPAVLLMPSATACSVERPRSTSSRTLLRTNTW